MAERVGFEPTCRLPDKTLSRRPRYDHFGTSPYFVAAALHSAPRCALGTALSRAAAGASLTQLGRTPFSEKPLNHRRGTPSSSTPPTLDSR